MKKTILILIVFISSLAYSQPKDMSIGIYIGPTVSTILNNANDDFIKSKVGFAGGLSYENHFSPIISIIGKLGYEKKGANSDEFTFTDANGYPLGICSGTYNYDYLTTTFLFSYSTNWFTNIYVYIGPYFNYLFSATKEFNNQYVSNEDITEYCNSIDIGVVLGIGVIIPIHEEWDLDLGISCNYGLLNTEKENNISSVGQYNFRNISYGLQTGVKYKF